MEYVAKLTNTSIEKLYVGAPAYIALRESGHQLWQANVSEINTDNAHIVTIDLDTYEVVDGAALATQEQESHLAKYGKYEPALYDRLQSATASDVLNISVWFSGVDVEKIRSDIFSKYPDIGLIESRPGPTTDLKLYDQVFAEATAAETKAYQEQAQSIVEQIEANSGKVLYVSQHAPMFFAEVTKDIVEALALLENVEMLYLSEPVKRTMDSVIPTDRVKAVWDRGNTGSGMNGNSGVKVAIVEDDGIDFDHPDIADGAYFSSTNKNIADHATWVAGIVASTHPTFRGVAYGAPALYSANAGTLVTNDIIAAEDAAITANSRVLNHSFALPAFFWGAIGDLARYCDYVVRYQHRTIAQASGNQSGYFVNDEGAAFNVITVGGINESNSTQWSDDTIWDEGDGNGSTYKNPLDGREKPEVVAVGKSIKSTGIHNVGDGFTTKSGTSGAAPQVAGLAALLMSRNNTLKDWPEAVKAIVMASAVHNVDGGSTLVSDKDGVGSIDALLADTIVQNGWWTIGSIATSVSENNYYFSAVAGEKVRVVLTYLSHTSNGAPYNADVIKSNLDLKVNTTGNQEIGVSISTVNNWEIVEFTAVDTGQYKIRVIRGPSNTNDNELLGLAWSRMANYLPDVRAQNGWNSTIYVRNDDSQPTTAFVTFLNANGTVNGTPSGHAISANGVWSFTPPSGWNGSAVVDGSEDLSVVVEHATATEKMDYTGIGGYIGGWGATGNTLYSPSLKNNYASRTGKIYVVNVGSASTNIDVSLRAADNVGSLITCNPANLQGMQPGKQATFQASDCATSAGTIYGVSLAASQPLAAMAVEYNSSDGSLTAAANLMRGGAATNYAPIFKYDYGGNRATLVAQNVGTVATTVTATYYHPTLGPWSENYTLEPLSTHVFSPLNAKNAYGINMSPNTLATTVVTVPTGQKVAITLYENKVGGNWRMQQSGSNLGSKLAILPEVYRGYVSGGATWGSAFLVMNTGSSNANITVRYYDVAGNGLSGANQTGTAAPQNAIAFNVSNNSQLPASFQGQQWSKQTSPSSSPATSPLLPAVAIQQ